MKRKQPDKRKQASDGRCVICRRGFGEDEPQAFIRDDGERLGPMHVRCAASRQFDARTKGGGA